MTPRRSALLAMALVVVAVLASLVATQHTKATSNVEALLGSQGSIGEAAVRPAPGYGPLPDLSPATAWDNSVPLSDATLRGKVVLLDIWTASCINCRRTFPFLRRLQATYATRGLVIVGVHSPEFDFEKSHAYVARSVRELNVTWPVAEDPQMAIWNELSNQYWPANYLADRQGNIRYTHFGEGDEQQIEGAVRALLADGGSAGNAVVGHVNETQLPPTAGETVTPETYLGTARGTNLSGTVGFSPSVTRFPDWASAPAHSVITLTWSGRDVYALLAPGAGNAPVTVQVRLDGRAVPVDRRGPDVTQTAAGTTIIRVTQQDLFHVLTGPAVSSGTLTFMPLDGSVLGYTFTFGG